MDNPILKLRDTVKRQRDFLKSFYEKGELSRGDKGLHNVIQKLDKVEETLLEAASDFQNIVSITVKADILKREKSMFKTSPWPTALLFGAFCLFLLSFGPMKNSIGAQIIAVYAFLALLFLMFYIKTEARKV